MIGRFAANICCVAASPRHFGGDGARGCSVNCSSLAAAKELAEESLALQRPRPVQASVYLVETKVVESPAA